LSLVALLLAIFRLPESKHPGSQPAARRIWDWGSFRQSLAVPSIGLLLATIFMCVFSFATYETTLSMLLKGSRVAASSPFHFSFRQVCLTYAYIGFILAVVQGGFVRRMAGRISEAHMSAGGAVVEFVGYGCMVLAVAWMSITLIFISAALVVAGFSMMQPNLNSLLSRRSDPTQQGAVMGVGQSVSSLARILGAFLGIPLLRLQFDLPYYVAVALMMLGLALLVAAARRGKDYEE
jgi:hypothetical protein